jgi:hypothetical protein
MNVKALKKIGTLSAALLMASACNDSERTGVSLSIVGIDQQLGAGSLSSLNTGTKQVNVTDENGAVVGTIVLEEAYVALEEIEFENDQDELPENDPNNEIEYEGPFLVDLINDTVTPSLGAVNIDAGLYSEIEMTLYPVGSDLEDESQEFSEASESMSGRSIYLRGFYTGPSASGAQSNIPFEMSFDLDEEFEVEGSDLLNSGLSINVGETARVTVAFRLQQWFDFANAETNQGLSLSPSQITLDNGAVNLTENSSDPSIRELIKNNILFSADYDDDDDDDDDEEDDNDED